MLRFLFPISIIIVLALVTSCKKKKEEPQNNEPATTPPPAAYDFTLSAFPNQTGNQWIYVNVVKTQVCGVTCGTCCTSYPDYSYTSTITVIADTLVGSNPGKIWVTQANSMPDIKHVAYYNTTSQLFYIIPIDSTKGHRATSFKLPLLKNSSWQNTSLTPLDTSYAKGIEQYYNGNEYNNVINVERKNNVYYDNDLFKVNNKGIVYHKSNTLTIQTVQATFVETQRILVTTNF